MRYNHGEPWGMEAVMGYIYGCLLFLTIMATAYGSIACSTSSTHRTTTYTTS